VGEETSVLNWNIDYDQNSVCNFMLAGSALHIMVSSVTCAW
jgi:hypothetical protein